VKVSQTIAQPSLSRSTFAKKAKVKRYVYAGSCSAYGYTENQLFNEDSPAVSFFLKAVDSPRVTQGAVGILVSIPANRPSHQ
jgi:hypothetical protein